ncbi:GlsB/YeaQ/YmgE family stress response membrane protein [Halomonas aquatica]|uniref:GlsB/YeaQ/YmgE family stress response membrane protein n=1 Tax=Halomonas aquatica TaxID=3151123 RepID=A0ABV1NCC1_9GAMM
MGIIAWLIIGGLAGWIAGHIMRGGGFGILGNIGVGVVGAVIGGWMFSLLGLQAGGFIGSLVTAIAGAVVLLWVIAKVRKA